MKCGGGRREQGAEMATKKFFDESKEQSRVKTAIVTKYFDAWARVIVPTARKWQGPTNPRIAYIDLFAGPGRYDDGTTSTPLLILEKAIADENLREMLVAVFNDRDVDHARLLQTAIAALPGIELLKHQPRVENEEVGEEMVKSLEATSRVPTLSFIDPWGYKGLSLRLVNAAVKDWGCDCIFFFNYNRINAGISNPFVKQHMDALFGEARADRLREKLKSLSPADRELAIIEEIAAALKEMGGTYVLPFTFVDANGTRTSHHLIFVSKHVRGYEIMKDIMARESSAKEQGIASFTYNPADARFPTLFALNRPLDELADDLAVEFGGRTMTMLDVYNAHHVDTRFVKKNYKDALNKLEADGRITANPPAAKRRKLKGEVTFADDVAVTFPVPSGKRAG